MAIGNLEQGQCGRVSFIRGGYNLLNRLLDLGIEPGANIRAIKTKTPNGPVEISVRNSKVILRKGLASKVFVDLEETRE